MTPLNQQMTDILGFGFGIEDTVLLAVGPLTIQPNSTPYRFVLRLVEGRQFVVHRQFWNGHHFQPCGITEQLMPVLDGSPGYAGGHYFGLNQLEAATACWLDRIREHLTYFRSLEGQEQCQHP